MRRKVIISIIATQLLVALCFSIGTVSAAGDSDSQIRVKLSAYLGNQNSINLSISGHFIVEEDGLNLSGAYVLKVESGQLILYKNGIEVKNYGTSFTVNPSVYHPQNVISINGRNYLGSMEFEVENERYVRPYNTLPVEDYLKGVVSKEMSPSWGNQGGMGALKAQAVAARTYAYGVSPIDDGQSDQAYTGYYWYDTTNRAVEETQGLVLKYNGQIIGANALYSSSNGGKVHSKVNSWGDAPWNHVPYLQAKEDPYDAKSSSIGNQNQNWNLSITKTQIDLTDINLTQPELWWNKKKEVNEDTVIINHMKSWLKANGYIAPRYEVKIVSIPELTFDVNVPTNKTIKGKLTIQYMLRDAETNQYVMENGQIRLFSTTITDRAHTFRMMVTTNIMKSLNIKSVQDDGTKITVNGSGWGHGIGMSQYGAYQMSKEGKGFQEILNFYYPGTITSDVVDPTGSIVQ